MRTPIALFACSCFALPAVAQLASLSVAGGSHAAIAGSPDFAMPQFTASLWLRPTGPGNNGGGTLITCGQRPGTGSFLTSWWMGWQASTGRVLAMAVHQYSVSGTVATSNATVPLNTWAHAAFTFDGTTLRVYINGVLDQTTPFGFTGIDYPASPAINLGYFTTGGPYTFSYIDGQIDEVMVWGRVLSADEIASMSSCAINVDGNAIRMVLPFTGNSLADFSGQGHNAAAVGTVGFGAQPGPVIPCGCTADFNNDGDYGTDQDIEAFFACLAGNCCVRCGLSDFNGDGDFGTDQDIESFFRVLAGANC